MAPTELSTLELFAWKSLISVKDQLLFSMNITMKSSNSKVISKTIFPTYHVEKDMYGNENGHKKSVLK